MSVEYVHGLAALLARFLELAGAAVIVAGAVVLSIVYVTEAMGSYGWRASYERYRSNLGRCILLGLELLVGADIIATITAPLSDESVGLLGAIVVIRTFLSFSLETEIEGCWPWQRRRLNRSDQAPER